MMKKINIIVGIFAMLIALSCENDRITYNGIVMVSVDSQTANFVVKDEPGQRITLSVFAANIAKEDILVKLKVSANNDAINGTHYNCPTSVTIPAGQCVATYNITASYDEVEAGKVYTITIEIDPDGTSVPVIEGSDVQKVNLMRYIAIDEFVGTYDAVDVSYWDGPMTSTLYITMGANDTLWLENIEAIAGLSSPTPVRVPILLNLDNFTFRMLVGKPIYSGNFNLPGGATHCFVVPEAYRQPYEVISGVIDPGAYALKIGPSSPVAWGFFIYRSDTGAETGYVVDYLVSSVWTRQ